MKFTSNKAADVLSFIPLKGYSERLGLLSDYDEYDPEGDYLNYMGLLADYEPLGDTLEMKTQLTSTVYLGTIIPFVFCISP